MASSVGCMDIIYAHLCCTLELSRWVALFLSQNLHLIMLFLSGNSTFYLLFGKKSKKMLYWYIRWFCGRVVSALDYEAGNPDSIPGSGWTID